MIEWYFPWAQLDLPLRLGLLAWLAVIGIGYGIYWRTIIRGKPWLRRGGRK